MPAHSRDDHIRMMRHPDDWPMWPVLPLKRGGIQGEMGVMFEESPRVYHSNMYMRITPETPHTDYESHEAVYDDGWRVD